MGAEKVLYFLPAALAKAPLKQSPMELGTYLESREIGAENLTMNTPTREEFEARLEAVEARMDKRLTEISGKINEFIARLDQREIGNDLLKAEREKALDARDQKLELIATQAKDAAERAAGAAEKAAGLRASFWASAIVTVLAVFAIAAGMYIGMKQSDESLIQATLSVFQAGQNTPPPKK
ncbi:MAG: hypothetical protein AB1704_33940 [Pseudomonadota bacterium]|jgi:hypothetical protein|uniref:hypothetical protein n=1 Tax=Burkholderiaceae TaxID=119060 RepID=UPI0010F6D27A|nr:hypothetical protein [Burkholderia sp. 4M9327F10]